MSQKLDRGIVLLFHDYDTRRWWVVSSMPRPHFTTIKDPVPILQEAKFVPGPVWKGGEYLVRTGIRSRTVQLLVSSYTDWATRPARMYIPYPYYCFILNKNGYCCYQYLLIIYFTHNKCSIMWCYSEQWAQINLLVLWWCRCSSCKSGQTCRINCSHTRLAMYAQTNVGLLRCVVPGSDVALHVN